MVYQIVQLKLFLTGLAITISLVATAGWQVEKPGRDSQSFNDNWLFHKGPAQGAEAPGYDDSAWRSVSLPHDWAIEGPFSDYYNARVGGLPVHGIGWYRKSFRLPEEAAGKRVTIEFDGAMNNSEVWINGHRLGERPFGYIGFEYDMTPFLNQQGENVIAVRLAPEELSSRWYPGAGLYRNVWLEIKSPVHVGHWGTFVRSQDVTKDRARVAVETTVVNRAPEEVAVEVLTDLIDPEGHKVASGRGLLRLQPDSEETVLQDLTLNHPRRWDIKHPHLYKAKTRLIVEGKPVDKYETPFGIRTIRFSSTEGFLLNGRRVQFQGVCMHHDLGALGAAVNTRATQRQLEIMKSMGVNAIRTSHNPPSPELRALCDQMGLLLIVEVFDEWAMGKVRNGYNKHFAEWHERDLKDTIRRDRNSPSVIMWSIGNEILEQQLDDQSLIRRLAKLTREMDSTRPVTAGFNNYPAPYENGMAEAVDVIGINYKPLHYGVQQEKHPDWIIYGSETSSCVSTRGVYHFPIERYEKHPSKQITSYDVVGPPWAYPPDVEFAAHKETPSVLGEFIWTGFDYLGEPTPFGGRDNDPREGYWNMDWPARSSYFGAVDLAGFPKDRFFLYQSQWTDEPMVHLLPHWNWEGMEQKPIPVFAYSNAEEVELFLDGKSLGKRRPGVDTVDLPLVFLRYEGTRFESEYRVNWSVPYQPGKLKAVAYKNGRIVAEKNISTAGQPRRILLEPDRTTIHGDGYDLSFVTVKAVDAAGNFVPLADDLVTFSVSGPGEIAAVDNGNPATTDPFQANWRKLFNGLAMVVLRAKSGTTGEIQLLAEAENLEPATAVILAVE